MFYCLTAVKQPWNFMWRISNNYNTSLHWTENTHNTTQCVHMALDRCQKYVQMPFEIISAFKFTDAGVDSTTWSWCLLKTVGDSARNCLVGGGSKRVIKHPVIKLHHVTQLSSEWGFFSLSKGRSTCSNPTVSKGHWDVIERNKPTVPEVSANADKCYLKGKLR